MSYVDIKLLTLQGAVMCLHLCFYYIRIRLVAFIRGPLGKRKISFGKPFLCRSGMQL